MYVTATRGISGIGLMNGSWMDGIAPPWDDNHQRGTGHQHQRGVECVGMWWKESVHETRRVLDLRGLARPGPGGGGGAGDLSFGVDSGDPGMVGWVGQGAMRVARAYGSGVDARWLDEG